MKVVKSAILIFRSQQKNPRQNGPRKRQNIAPNVPIKFGVAAMRMYYRTETVLFHRRACYKSTVPLTVATQAGAVMRGTGKKTERGDARYRTLKVKNNQGGHNLIEKIYLP